MNAVLGKPKLIIAYNELNMANVKEILKKENIEIHFINPKAYNGRAATVFVS